jgi:UDP-GlcNAc:undecaprenyl-phosphate GlcNAc-1-phosphate transferase
MMFFQIFITIALTALFSLAITPAGIALAWRFGMIDRPGSEAHKIHKAPMPRAGGLVIFAVVVLGCAFSGLLKSQSIAPIILASVVILAFGIWDDINGIRAPWKMLGQALATSILVWQGIQVHIFKIAYLDIFVTYFWMIGITNAFNLVDSMDGLAVGLAGITAAFLMIGTFYGEQGPLVLFGAILLGGCIGIYYFNHSPARLFLGDSGAQLLGFMLAALANAYTPPGLPQASSWFVPILFFSIPIFDTTLVTVSRLLKNSPVYRAGLDHTYHRFVALGMSSQRAVTTMHLGAILINCLAFVALYLSPLWANGFFVLVVLSGIILLFWLDSRKKSNS